MASFAVRDPALFAYQWACLDEVSEGRMLLAVCNGLQKKDGASEREGQHFGGVRDKERARRVEEFIALVRQLWTGEPIDFAGSSSSTRDCRFCPRRCRTLPPSGSAPTRLPGPQRPGCCAASRRWPTASFRCARLRATSKETSPCSRTSCAQLAGDADAFPVAAYHSINVGSDREACLDETQRFFDYYYGDGVFGREAAASMAAVGNCLRMRRATVRGPR